MVTPNKNEIIEKAFELNAKRSYDVNLNTPTESELKEDGTFNEAKLELMRSNDNAFRDYIEKEARSLGLIEDKLGYVSKDVCSLSYDFEEQKATNTLISGTNKTGKSRLAMLLASRLRQKGFNVVAFDNSGAWRKISDLPNYKLVPNEDRFKISLHANMLLDMSLLRPSNQRKIVDEILEIFWINAVNSDSKEWQIVVLEEFQLYGRWLRGRLSENIYRIMSAGRNQRIRVIAITPSMALIDPLFIRLCGQRFHFKLAIEENSLRKFRRYYGNDYTRIVQSLECGFALHYVKEKLRVVKIPLFQRKVIEQIV